MRRLKRKGRRTHKRLCRPNGHGSTALQGWKRQLFTTYKKPLLCGFRLQPLCLPLVSSCLLFLSSPTGQWRSPPLLLLRPVSQKRELGSVAVFLDVGLRAARRFQAVLVCTCKSEPWQAGRRRVSKAAAQKRLHKSGHSAISPGGVVGGTR